jgi:hypothetical protein
MLGLEMRGSRMFMPITGYFKKKEMVLAKY